MLSKTIKSLVFTIIIIVILFVLGYGINLLFGIEIFSIPQNETINFSGLLNMILLFITILVSSGIFQSDKFQNQLLKIFSDNADIVIEIDKNMIFVPEYEFTKHGTQLDIREAEIKHISTVFHFDFLTYNRTLSEATIKEIKMYLGNSGKVYIAKSIAEKVDGGYTRAGLFKQFMILKGRSAENKITFEATDDENILLIDNYVLDMNNIRFVIEYNTNNQTKYIEKSIELNITESDINVIKECTKDELAKRIIGPDRRRFNDRCLINGSYYTRTGLNHDFQLK